MADRSSKNREGSHSLTTGSRAPQQDQSLPSQRHMQTNVRHDAPDSEPYHDALSSRPSAKRRRSSASEMLKDTIHSVEAKISSAFLLLYHELPDWRRDNPSILSGYRPESNSYVDSIRSVFEVHNESVNIWSHLLGSLAFLGLFVYAIHYGWEHVVDPRYETATKGDRLAFACFFLGAVSCMGMSATFHCLSNHSQRVQKWGNKLDYSGIVILIVGSYVPALYYGFYCAEDLMAWYGGAIVALGLACMAVSWLEYFRQPAFRTFRASIFVGLGVSGVVPVIHGVFLYGYTLMNHKMGLNWVLLQGILYITGATTYALRFPEKKWPGRFDIWGSSHQIFHWFVVAAATSHLVGMVKAFDWNHGVMSGGCHL
ncbi:ADIPOR-like receptor SPBC12C2.09c [Zalerion maritima]|uniref:ADIPOR-like receptor SPBC12C2.09c n=1 Tax=Zalerion maritima TaxID=339359 RepID=A0AAD5RR42_9PEZI|nr:ADIPOR-like receptor SPBC12C2.09c [Zalerion maritima]